MNITVEDTPAEAEGFATARHTRTIETSKRIRWDRSSIAPGTALLESERAFSAVVPHATHSGDTR